MAGLTDETKRRVAPLREAAPELLAERGISGSSKVCNFLAVALRLRKMGLTYLPAEMPGGSRMGEQIDRYYLEHQRKPAQGVLSRLGFGRRGEAARKEAELRAKRRTLEEAYHSVVPASAAYVAHLAWLDRLGLNQLQVKRRPTLREMFIYTDRDDRQRLIDLEDEAKRNRVTPTTGGAGDREQALIEYVYTTEYNRDYLRGLGALLGYPECCTERYAEDRLKGQNVEQRASEQIREMQEAGRSVDVHAYFVKDFFPCTPECPEAIARGNEFEAAFAMLGDEVSDLYVGALHESFALVQNYPLLIMAHRRRLEEATDRQ